MVENPPIELIPPDLGPHRGNTGIPYVTTLDSARPGPHALLLALVHGNELCGALALDHLFRTGFRPARGRVSLAFANVAAFQRFDKRNPTASRFVDEDFNRVWDKATLDSRRHSIELDRARQLRPLIETVDTLLDLHSMQFASAPLTLAGMAPKGTALARRIGVPGLIVRDEGHAAGRRLRDYGRFAEPADPAAAVLIECGQHWAAASADLAIEASLRFLAALDLLEPDYRARHLNVRVAPPQRVVEVTEAVTVTTERFHFLSPFTGMEVIPARGTPIARDGTRDIATPYDDCVLIMPSRRLVPGQTAVRLGRYVDAEE